MPHGENKLFADWLSFPGSRQSDAPLRGGTHSPRVRRAGGVPGAMEQKQGEVSGDGPRPLLGPELRCNRAEAMLSAPGVRRVLRKALGHCAGPPGALREGARPGQRQRGIGRGVVLR